MSPCFSALRLWNKRHDLGASPTNIIYLADIRRRCIIRSQFGNLMVIPRERKLVRIYVQVSSDLAQKYLTEDRDPEVIMEAVRKIMHPFAFNASHLEWSTIYSVSKG